MKLSDLAEFRQGIELPDNKILTGARTLGPYYQYLRPEDFENKTTAYVSIKELRKLKSFTSFLVLSYGDYLLYNIKGTLRLYRYDSTTGYTIPNQKIIIIRTNFNIVKEFFGYEKNREYVYKKLKDDQVRSGDLPSLECLGDVEIMTDNILELEEANTAEQIGIRKPLDTQMLPFNIHQRPITIDKVLKRIFNKELLLDTEFQRRPGLWDIGVKSRLLESMIIRLPLPAFYFDGGDDNEWLVIDGLQRLSAINDYVNGVFGLTNLDFLPDLEGKKFDELPRPYQRNIEEYEIFAYILQKGTPKSVTYKIFKSINTSALKLEPQEIRHAINPGIPANFLKSVVEESWFFEKVILSDRLKDRMEDREAVLRFIAFQETSYRDYSPTIVDFLDNAMVDLYNIPGHAKQLYAAKLKETLELIERIFGKSPYSRSAIDPHRKSYTFNNILFELLTYGFSKVRFKPGLTFVEIKEKTINFFAHKNDRYWEYDVAYSQDGLIRRFEEFEQFLVNMMK